MSDEISQEFVAGQEITMQMMLTPQQYSMLKEWSAIVPTLYMLDICVVGATKLTDQSLTKHPRKANLVALLRTLDRPKNCFSYLFALMEKVSDSRGMLTVDELKTQILADITSLRGFFITARVAEADDFLMGFIEELMGEPIESERAEYLRFLGRLNNHFKLQNSISPKKRLGTAEKIILEANALNISTQHPIVIIALACLYGNQSAKKLMKFKANKNEFDAENALADILLISRFAKIKLEIEHHGRNGSGYPRVSFITDDNGLSGLLKYFKPKSIKHQDRVEGRESQLIITVDLETILTEAKSDDYEAIANLLLTLD